MPSELVLSAGSPYGVETRAARYTQEQTELLERVYRENPMPTGAQRSQLLKDCPALAGLGPRQVKVWFQNRRCREKQKKEQETLKMTNARLTHENKDLRLENERLLRQHSEVVQKNLRLEKRMAALEKALGTMRNTTAMKLQDEEVAGPSLHIDTKPIIDKHLEDAISFSIETPTSRMRPQNGLSSALIVAAQAPVIHYNLQPPPPPLNFPPDQPPPSFTLEGSKAKLLEIAEQIKFEFLAKAKGTAVEWVPIPGVKQQAHPSLGIITIGNACRGVAARVWGLVPHPPHRVKDLLRVKTLWLQDCERCEILEGFVMPSGAKVDVKWVKFRAPTALAPPRDFYTMRYTVPTEDGGFLICERSLDSVAGEHGLVQDKPPAEGCVRAEMMASGLLIKPCAGGSNVIIVDHMDLEDWSVPEVIRPLYSSSAVLAHRVTMARLRYLKHVSEQESPQPLAATQQPPEWTAIAEQLENLVRGECEAAVVGVENALHEDKMEENDGTFDFVRTFLEADNMPILEDYKNELLFYDPGNQSSSRDSDGNVDLIDQSPAWTSRTANDLPQNHLGGDPVGGYGF